jgi:N-acetylmuramoyl-L-alanine amidase
MRKIENLIIHCTATLQHTKPQTILNFWKDELGWKNKGYHYLIDVDGKIYQLMNENDISNGVKGKNQTSINISYIGGIDIINIGEDNERKIPSDTRTSQQKISILKLLLNLKSRYPNAEIKGHNDFTTLKACPSYKVADDLSITLDQTYL